MTPQEYHLKKQQIDRLKNLLKGRFMIKEAIECMRAIIACEKYEQEQREKNADEFRTNN